MPDAPINPRITGLCTIFNPLYTGSLLSLGSGVLFGLLLAIGATQTTANRGNFSLLLGKETYILVGKSVACGEVLVVGSSPTRGSQFFFEK